MTAANSADLFIDGGSPLDIANVTGDSIATPRLPLGRHNVVIRKRSETVLGTCKVGSITSNGIPLPPPTPKRKIEIIGDSISVGYGLDGTFPCVNTAAIEDNAMTY